MTPNRTMIATLAAALLVATAVSAQTTEDPIRREIEALKKGQEQIQKDLQEIKRLLANQQPKPAADPMPVSVDIGSARIRGSAAAQVAIIEYSDYECPFCARYVTQTLPQIDKEYIQTGKVKYVFKDLPLSFHKNAFKAAEATHCAAEQGKYWEMHDQLFENQKQLTEQDLVRHAGSIGIDQQKFEQCLQSGRSGAAIRKDTSEANEAGITGTPTFLIGVVEPNSSTVKIRKKLVGARGYADFKASIDAVLGDPSVQ